MCVLLRAGVSGPLRQFEVQTLASVADIKTSARYRGAIPGRNGADALAKHSALLHGFRLSRRLYQRRESLQGCHTAVHRVIFLPADASVEHDRHAALSSEAQDVHLTLLTGKRCNFRRTGLTITSPQITRDTADINEREAK